MTRNDKRIDKRCVKRAWSEQWREVRPAMFLLCACLLVLILVYQ
ncbi:hypothetical protein ABID12_002040 [Martelella mangrovi]|uniref:Uncharacterized protein n=1 Tax=Martelella mangrovi TaxID=1397477 RepID=A0ABV2IB10_9HYPH